MAAFGTPGTVSSALLRVVELIVTATTLLLVVGHKDFLNYPVFGWIMTAALSVQATWSFNIAMYDTYMLWFERGNHQLGSSMLPVILIFQWVMEKIMLATSMTIVGANMFVRDNHFCSLHGFKCKRADIVMALSLILWTSNMILVAMLQSTCAYL